MHWAVVSWALLGSSRWQKGCVLLNVDRGGLGKDSWLWQLAVSKSHPWDVVPANRPNGSARCSTVVYHPVSVRSARVRSLRMNRSESPCPIMSSLSYARASQCVRAVAVPPSFSISAPVSVGQLACARATDLTVSLTM